MSLLEKIKNKKDVYVYLLKRTQSRKAELMKTYDKSASSRQSWHHWNGVESVINGVISDFKEIEVDCEMALQSISVDLSALRGK